MRFKGSSLIVSFWLIFDIFIHTNGKPSPLFRFESYERWKRDKKVGSYLRCDSFFFSFLNAIHFFFCLPHIWLEFKRKTTTKFRQFVIKTICKRTEKSHADHFGLLLKLKTHPLPSAKHFWFTFSLPFLFSYGLFTGSGCTPPLEDSSNYTKQQVLTVIMLNYGWHFLFF